MPTKKIADLPRVCRHPEHNPPNMMVYIDGVWEHVCPACGVRQMFTVSKPTFGTGGRSAEQCNHGAHVRWCNHSNIGARFGHR